MCDTPWEWVGERESSQSLRGSNARRAKYILARLNADASSPNLRRPCGHDALSRGQPRKMTRFVSRVLQGAGSDWWKHLHYQHHAKPNVVSRRPAPSRDSRRRKQRPVFRRFRPRLLAQLSHHVVVVVAEMITPPPSSDDQ